MSTEFYGTMEQIEKKAKLIKYLEGSHAELFTKYHGEAKMLLYTLDNLEKKIAEDLKMKAKATSPSTKKKK